METMFWTAIVVSSEPDQLPVVRMEAFLFANESSESMAGTNLWRVGIFGSTTETGSGPRFGYIPQVLNDKSTGQTLVSGLPLPVSGDFPFDIHQVGCSEFLFLCVEFTRNDAAEPYFPFHTNSGNDIFTSCRRAPPCDPLATLKRMATGPVSWGVRLVQPRRNAPSDIAVSVLMRASADSDVIQGRGLWRVGLFGSPSPNGSSPDRFNYLRQLLTPEEASRPLGPDVNLNFPALGARFDVLALGCSEFRYMCLEIAKGDEPDPDFVFHNEQQRPVVFCKSVNCPDAARTKPVVRLETLDWNMVMFGYEAGVPTNVSIGVQIAASDRTASVSGQGLWRIGIFMSEESDGSGERVQYREQILSEEEASFPISSEIPLVYPSLQTTMDITNVGCPNFNLSYMCIIFTKGDSPEADFTLSLQNGEAVSCKRVACQASAQQSGGKVALFQGVNVNWQTDSYRRDGLSDMRVTMSLTPDTGTSSIYGNRLWRMGVYASDSSQGTGVKYAYQSNTLDATAMQTPLTPPRERGVPPPPLTLEGRTRFDLREICEIRNKHPYFCVEFAKNDASSVPFTIPIQGGIIKVCSPYTCPESAGQGPRARYSDVSTSIDPFSVRSNGDADMSMTLTVNPTADTDYISGSGLWRVGLFASNDASGRTRYNEDRNILDSTEARRPMYPNRPVELRGSTTFPAGDLGCRYRYLCIEFAKGDRPSTDFSMQPSVMCQPQNCEDRTSSSTGTGSSSGRGTTSDTVARYESFSASTEPYTMDSNGDARITMNLVVTPRSNTDRITGNGLWRVGVFASNDANGRSRFHENRNIIDSYEAREGMYSGRSLDLRGTFNFPAGDLGCRYQYLCIEFAQGDNPSTDFSMQPAVSCQQQRCQQPPQPEPNPSSRGDGLVARHTRLSASTGHYTMDSNGNADMSMTVTVDPAADTDTIRGNDLWRVGVFASSDDRGRRRYHENRNILSPRESRESMYPQRPMELTGSFEFPAGDLGCRYQYMCVEFAKGDYPSVDFSMDPIISCQPQRCQERPAPEPEPNSNRDPSNQGSVAAYSSISASTDPYSIDSNGDASISMTLTVNPTADTDTIRGNDLWRVGVFASNDGRGRSRYHENRNILDPYAARENMYPRRTMDLTGTFDFPAGDLGCRYQYLCVEFAKGDSPSTDFTMQPAVSCQPQQCQQRPEPEPEPNQGPTARYTSFSANIADYTVQTNGAARMSLTANVNPSYETDTISGDGLWRLGVFASNDNTGRTRYHENRNVLDYIGSRRSMRSGRPMELTGNFNFPAAGHLGCTYRYLCVEFDKGESPSMDFNMRPTMSCEQQTCGRDVTSGGSGSNTGSSTGGNSGNPDHGTSPSSNPDVTLRSLSWAIRSDDPRQVEVQTSVAMDLNENNFGGWGSSNLWRMGIFTSSSPEGSDRYSEVRQILSDSDTYREIRNGVSSAFTANTAFDVRTLGCSPNKRYLCIEFGQGDRPRPGYTIAGANPRENSLVSCKRQECQEDPSIRVIAVRPGTVELREGERTPVTFDVNVRYDPVDTTRIQGSNLWKLQAWGSKVPDGSGTEMSSADQVLSAFQEDTALDPTAEFGFQDVSHTIDLTGRRCPEVKFICVRLQKDNPYPNYQLLARYDDPGRLVGCTKVTCVAKAKPMVTVTGVGVVREPFGAVRAGTSNAMTLEVNVNYDRATSTEVEGNPGWVVEMWGSAKKNGKGRKVSASTLDLGYGASRPFDASSALRFSNVPYDYDLRGQTCAKARFLCARVSKTGTFTLKAKPSKALTKCTSIPCLNSDGSSTSKPSRPARPSGGGRPQVRLSSMRTDFGTLRINPSGNSNMDLTYYVTAASTSDVPVGKNLWYLAAYLSDRADGSGNNRLGYTNNVLTPKQAKTAIAAGREVAIENVRFQFPASEIGCYPYYYLCIEFGKGSSTAYDMVVPSNGRMVSCDLQTCRT